MGIQRHEPCVHGKDKDVCVFCVMQAKIDNLIDRVEDLEDKVFGGAESAADQMTSDGDSPQADTQSEEAQAADGE